MASTRTEHDSFGPIEVPADVLWAAQTARSLRFFAIGEQRMPLPVVHALAWVKWASACVNRDLGLLDARTADAVADAALRVVAGEFDAQFPLSAWQTGSGTQSNMNVNEVVANIASMALGDRLGEARSVHPNDDVNRGQSSNDVFPTAMHLAVLLQSRALLLPALHALRTALVDKSVAFADVMKIGRTHLQDATPVTLGQEFGGYDAQLGLCETALRQAGVALQSLAIGGTAVGTGLNTHPQFGARVAARLARRLDLPLVQADNLFAAMAGHEALVGFHAALKMLAVALTKIGNDIRLMAAGRAPAWASCSCPRTSPAVPSCRAR